MPLSRGQDSSESVLGVDVRKPMLIKGQMAIREVREKTIGLLRGSLGANSAMSRTDVNRECTELVIGRKSMPVAGNRLILSDSGSIIGILEGMFIMEAQHLGTVVDDITEIGDCVPVNDEFAQTSYEIIDRSLYKIIPRAHFDRDEKVYQLGMKKNHIGKLIYN